MKMTFKNAALVFVSLLGYAGALSLIYFPRIPESFKQALGCAILLTGSLFSLRLIRGCRGPGAFAADIFSRFPGSVEPDMAPVTLSEAAHWSGRELGACIFDFRPGDDAPTRAVKFAVDFMNVDCAYLSIFLPGGGLRILSSAGTEALDIIRSVTAMNLDFSTDQPVLIADSHSVHSLGLTGGFFPPDISILICPLADSGKPSGALILFRDRLSPKFSPLECAIARRYGCYIAPSILSTLRHLSNAA